MQELAPSAQISKELAKWETELDTLERIDRNLYRLRREQRQHEMWSSLRQLVLIGMIVAAWYFRGI